jgi:transcription elongation factor Elf1
MLIVVVLLATVLLRVAIVGVVLYVILPKGFSCPRCASRLSQIWHPVLHRLLPHVEHRWCMRCGWSGLVSSSVARNQPRRALVKEIVPGPVNQHE